MPHGGLALANSFATALEGTLLFILMRRRLNGIEGKSVADGAMRVIVASLAMGIGLWIWLLATGNLNLWVIALGGVALGGIIYIAVITILRVPEIHMLIGMVTRRLLRSPIS
jgi:putative peptidoglycan lipid II flippase